MANKVNDIYELFCGISDKAQMKRLFDEIFTASEIKDVNLRWELLRQLSLGKPQREISHNLGISLCKITRGAKILKNKDGILRTVFPCAEEAKNAKGSG